jgi:ferric-dicitrate binding protein FerR (iron transport regulator)
MLRPLVIAHDRFELRGVGHRCYQSPSAWRIITRMHAKRAQPGDRTAAYRNLLKREDLTEAPTRRRMKWGFAALIAALALAGWLLTYWH